MNLFGINDGDCKKMGCVLNYVRAYPSSVSLLSNC